MKIGKRLLLQTEFFQIGDYFSIIQNTDYGTFQTSVEFGSYNWYDGYPIPNQISIYFFLNKTILCAVSLKAVYIPGFVFEHSGDCFRFYTFLQVPTLQFSIETKSKICLITRKWNNMHIASALPDSFYQHSLY